jgi:histidinol dehydrogenase
MEIKMSVDAPQILRIDTRQDDVRSRLEALRATLSPRGDVVSPRGRELTLKVFGQPLTPQQVVEKICGDVARGGLAAVLQYAHQLDGSPRDASTLRVPREELASAHARAEASFLEAVRRIAANIRQFQQAIRHQDVTVVRGAGVTLRQRYVPLDRVGICVPGGAAAYPSTLLMTAVPAQVAGVAQLAVVAPPTRFGAGNPDLLAVCHELGITEVYGVGGAQAVAALAYGVDGLPRVDKIVGPGNLFVALAKRQVYGEVDIDSIAGPSEVVILADDTTSPAFAAGDMLAQAEHAPGASVLIAWSDQVLQATHEQLRVQVGGLSRGALIVESLRDFAALIRVRDEDEACQLTDWMAPEHLHIAVESDHARRLAERIRHAGATFVGPFSPVAVGDYVAGPSHVLPTGGTARWASGLSVNDFLRAGSVIEYDRDALQAAADDLRVLADKEQLTAHRASVDIRLGDA